MKYKTVKPRKKCPTCGGTTKAEVKKFFCDQCDKQLSERLSEGELRTTVFHDIDIATKDFNFCSWKCCLSWVKNHRDNFKAENFRFFTLPYITERNQRAFFKAIMGRRGVER